MTTLNFGLGLLLWAGVLAAEEIGTKEECFPIRYQSTPCQNLERKIKSEIKLICQQAMETRMPLAELESQLAPYRAEPIEDALYRPEFREAVKNDCDACLKAQRLRWEADARAKE